MWCVLVLPCYDVREEMALSRNEKHTDTDERNQYNRMHDVLMCCIKIMYIYSFIAISIYIYVYTNTHA